MQGLYRILNGSSSYVYPFFVSLYYHKFTGLFSFFVHSNAYVTKSNYCVTPRSLPACYPCSRGACYLHLQGSLFCPGIGGRRFLQNVCNELPMYAGSYTQKTTILIVLWEPVMTRSVQHDCRLIPTRVPVCRSINAQGMWPINIFCITHIGEIRNT